MRRVSQVTKGQGAHPDAQVLPGQPATCRFSALKQRVTPEIAGQITGISADVAHDINTEATVHGVIIMALAAKLANLEELEMLSGIPVATYLRTKDRTPATLRML